MSKVLVTGVSGFIGSAVAHKFRREGHTVFGLVRDLHSRTALELQQHEITLVPGDVTEPDAWAKVAEECDILVSAAHVAANAPAANLATLQAFFAASAKSGQRKTVIMTSGCLVYGSAPPSVTALTEDYKCDAPQFVAWRLEQERELLNNDQVNGIVIRPSWVYGLSGSHISAHFGAQQQGKLVVFGDGDNSFALVHAHDLANLYYLAATQPEKARGHIFNAATYVHPIKEIATALARAGGFQGRAEHKEPSSAWERALTMHQPLDSSKAKSVLGWKPVMPDLVQHADTYFRAWQAAKTVKGDAPSGH